MYSTVHFKICCKNKFANRIDKRNIQYSYSKNKSKGSKGTLGDIISPTLIFCKTHQIVYINMCSSLCINHSSTKLLKCVSIYRTKFCNFPPRILISDPPWRKPLLYSVKAFRCFYKYLGIFIIALILIFLNGTTPLHLL